MPRSPSIELLPIWPSVARVLAALSIFMFHYFGLVQTPRWWLSAIGLATFSFLSGYLAHARKTPRRRWIVKRYFSVMIPHWVVILPVLAANAAIEYKPVSAGAAVITFLGGNLFLSNPIYVITWYVTFVLLLYAYLLADSFVDGWHRLLLTGLALPVFHWLDCAQYFIAFSIGLYLSTWFPPNPVRARQRLEAELARVTFRAQELCYPFFLAHGAVLLGMLKVLRLGPVPLLVVSLLVSVVAAWVVQTASRPLLRLALDAFGGDSVRS